tara:strand:+ start:374 stop:1789 length:1416 start_codon:yes stop_codon:yes gene_type:complete
MFYRILYLSIIFLAHMLIILFCELGDFHLNISFLLNWVSLFVILYFHLIRDKEFSPYISSYLVFGYLFFLVSPMYQIYTGIFPNTYPIKINEVVKLNFYILIWNTNFLIAYQIIKKRKKKKLDRGWEVANIQKDNYLIYLTTLTALSLLIILFFQDFIIDKLLYNNNGFQKYSVVKSLIIQKSFFIIPFIGFLYSIVFLRQNRNQREKWKFVLLLSILLLFLLILVKNPMLAKRNAIGPLIITIFVFLIPKWFNKNIRFLFFLLLSMVVGFPLVSIFTHSKHGTVETILKPFDFLKEIASRNLLRELLTIHYDAYSNILATMEYINSYGIVLGEQLQGSLLFFVPRSLWTDKPVKTGKLIGKHLMDNYNMEFDNLSNPLLSEGLISLGAFSLFLFPVVLAFLVVKMLQWQYSKDFFKQIVAIYFSIYLIFILRGDLSSSLSFFTGTFIGVYLIPKGLFFLLGKILKFKKVK